MARKIVLTSGKGGVGKTTVTANLGVALARLNKRVVLVDVDLGLNNLDVVMGAENKIVFQPLSLNKQNEINKNNLELFGGLYIKKFNKNNNF